MAKEPSGRAPFASRHALLVPIASLALSTPTIVTGLAAICITMYEVLARRAIVSTAQTLQLPGLGVGLGCLYLLMGPLLALVLCISQRTHAEATYDSALLLGYRIKRLNTIALRAAVLALGMIAVMVVISILNTAINPQ
jgi:hypothetical protein